jgi:hypothetical protein
MHMDKKNLERIWSEIWSELEAQIQQGSDPPRYSHDKYEAFIYCIKEDLENSDFHEMGEQKCAKVFTLLYRKNYELYQLKNNKCYGESENSKNHQSGPLSLLRGKIRDLESILRNRNDETSRMNEELSRFKEENQGLAAELSSRQLELASINEKYESHKEEKRFLEIELERIRAKNNELMSQLAGQNRNRLSTSVAGSKAQHHLLYGDFKVLVDQDFQALCDEIFLFKTESKTSKRLNRKDEVTHIKKMLTEKMLVEVADGLSTSAASKVAHKSSNSKELLDFVEDYLESSPSTEIKKSLLDLSRNSFELVSKICDADPPGLIWSETRGNLFDETKHEALPWCEDSGNICIDLTVSPGYSAVDSETGEERVLVKAVVSTIPVEQDEINQDQNLNKKQSTLSPSEETSITDGQDLSKDNLSDSAIDDAQSQVEAQSQAASPTATESISSNDETNAPDSKETQSETDSNALPERRL